MTRSTMTHQLASPTPTRLQCACLTPGLPQTDRVADSGVERATSTASETASQLLAKILDQLSLSAWLPSGALVLLIGFVIELGSEIYTHSSPGAAVSATFVTIGKSSIGSLLLVGLVIVIVTMLTQAFSFGAIRVLEGYWGTAGWMEWLASRRADRHRTKRDALYDRYELVRAEAIDVVLAELAAEPQVPANSGETVTFTEAMRKVLEARVKGISEPKHLAINVEQRRISNEFDWMGHADRNLARRELNLRKRFEDYPVDVQHVLPTRLGNVLRAHEDATGLDEVEDFVDRVFDSLPFSMQLLHDEQRTRLDLYCSMVFVLATATVVAVARFGFHHWRYQAAALVLAGFGCWVVYRAAISSARYFGSVLETIVVFVSERDQAEVERRPHRPRDPFGVTSWLGAVRRRT